jgi:uncharacterized protein (TIGR00251 family)
VIEIKEHGGSATFRVKVQPRASRTEIVGEHADAIKIRITAPPVEGKANEECRRFIAKLLGVAPSEVEIVSGDSSRDKLIRVHNVSARHIRDALGRN